MARKNDVIRSHREELLNGKTITDSIADFEVLGNELKCFYSVLLHYDVNLQYFSGEIVRDVIARRLSKRMGAEFTNHIRSKGLMDDTAEYLLRLLAWGNKKSCFGNLSWAVIFFRATRG